ncbi:DeoR/GlpR family DNA-binding transcription regulator [Saccharopolyspora spinosa]|uniref:DeoR/GlpR family DNA-binding transcription regulator n=1 Tax=Saccharopolyspora spinosa TaxID=60894 RepID=UPI0002379639|nr:DeoR/GlpR family DNA-binding transcription regulator [Saccharopolyspora spinosa]
MLASGFVRIEGLAAKHGVSGMTVHRDLGVLEQQGWLRKVRGGATSTPTALLESSVRARIGDAADEKARLAKHAVRLVSPGQVIALDYSTSALGVAERLAPLGPLTVVTNFLSVINLLSGEPGLHLIGLGGDYQPSYDAFLRCTPPAWPARCAPTCCSCRPPRWSTGIACTARRRRSRSSAR